MCRISVFYTGNYGCDMDNNSRPQLKFLDINTESSSWKKVKGDVEATICDECQNLVMLKDMSLEAGTPTESARMEIFKMVLFQRNSEESWPEDICSSVCDEFHLVRNDFTTKQSPPHTNGFRR